MGVVVPAHNEERRISACLRSVHAAAARAAPVRVVIVVTADACTDDTTTLAVRGGAHVVRTRSHNVGAARAVGAQHALALLANAGPDLWLAMTDADTTVPADWLTHQLEWARRGYDAVLGTIRLTPGTALPLLETRHNAHYFRTCRFSEVHRRWEHPHVHGANLGVSASAYVRVGGFAALRSGEDCDLAARLSEAGYGIARTDQHPVHTAARLSGRAPGGLSDLLASMHCALINPVV
ncbi:glycosyltransferase family 2 protein [Streptomyces sp. ME109]|uniref:glycosyltransferase n=1 Tax=Streptomyces sp. me109 TaxID=1827853 RepID=UPI0021CA46AA|nr:glycosyltransferase [Streptomyces sp. me109]